VSNGPVNRFTITESGQKDGYNSEIPSLVLSSGDKRRADVFELSIESKQNNIKKLVEALKISMCNGEQKKQCNKSIDGKDSK
jgi:non-homologous end joining protein Ku